MTGLLMALRGVITDEEVTDDGALQTSPHTLAEGCPEDCTPVTDPDDATVRNPQIQCSLEISGDHPAPAEMSEPPPSDHPPETNDSAVNKPLDDTQPQSLNLTARESVIYSPRSPDQPSRDGSIDSGYAECRTSPIPSQWRRSTLNLLSSPFGSSTTRAFPPACGRLSVLVSPRFGSFPSSASERASSPVERVAQIVDAVRRHSNDAVSRPPASLSSFPTPQNNQGSPLDDPFSVPSPSPSSLDSPDSYPALQPSSTADHEDGESELPGRDETALNRKRASSTLTVMPGSEATEPPPPLPEPLSWVADAEDDTVTSMYGLYHSSSSDHIWSPPSPVQNYSRPSSSASFYPLQPSSTTVELLSPKSQGENPVTGSPLGQSRSSSALSTRTDQGPSSSTVPIGFRGQKRRASTTLHQSQPLSLSSPPSPIVEIRQPPPSGPRSLRPLRLSMVLNSGRPLPSPLNETPPSDPSPSPSTQSDFSISNSRLLSSARSSIIPGHILNARDTTSLSPLLLGTPNGSHQHHLPNFGSLSSITVTSPTPSQVSTPSSAVRRQYNPLIPNTEFRNSIHLHSRGSSTLSETFYVVQEEEEDTHDTGNESNSSFDPEETIQYPLSASRSSNLGGSPQPLSVFSDSPVSTTAPILDQMIDAHAANPLQSSTVSSSTRLPTRHLHTSTSLRRQTPHPTPDVRPSPVSTKGPDLPNSSHPTRTHTRRQPSHAIATPRPTLMFAIASDDVSRVQRVLDNGEANPNDQVGPQSALKFALTNDQLTNRLEIVKTLLAYGADPASLKNSPGGQDHSRRSSVVISGSSPAHIGHSLNASNTDGRKEVDPAFESMKSQLDPATRYFINRADAPKTRRASALIHRSCFRPLARMRYDVIGQDCAFEQLFRCLSIQSQDLSVNPLVVMLCGPSGHGKSLFARKFGSLLGVPTHTVNMTTLRSTHELWQSYSMSPYEEPSTSTLAEFLTDNEGKRCVVVLDVHIFFPASSHRIV